MPDGLPMTRMTSRDLRFSNEDRDFEQDDRSTSPTIVSDSIPGSAYQLQQQLRESESQTISIKMTAVVKSHSVLRETEASQLAEAVNRSELLMSEDKTSCQ